MYHISNLEKIDIPDDFIRYSYLYSNSMIKALTCTHDFSPYYQLPLYSSSLYLSRKRKTQWYHLFNADQRVEIPFPYMTPCFAILFFRILDDLQINLKHVRFLKNHFVNMDKACLDPGDHYDVSLKVIQKDKISDQDILVICRTTVCQKNQELFYIDNYFCATNTPWRSGSLNKNTLEEFKDLYYRKSNLQGEKMHQFKLRVPSRMGGKFGKLSGDYNVIHISSLLAKLFGFPKALIQCLCSTSYVIKFLADNLNKKLLDFTITYCRAIYVESDITFKFGPKDNFEICDNKDNVLSFGTYKC